MVAERLRCQNICHPIRSGYHTKDMLLTRLWLETIKAVA